MMGHLKFRRKVCGIGEAPAVYAAYSYILHGLCHIIAESGAGMAVHIIQYGGGAGLNGLHASCEGGVITHFPVEPVQGRAHGAVQPVK